MAIQKTGETLHYKYFLLLSTLYITILLTSTVTSYRLVQINFIVANGGSFIFPLSYFVADIIAEVYGYSLSRRLIWTTFVCTLFFGLAVYIVNHLPAPDFWHDRAIFDKLFGHLFFLIGGFILASTASSFVNVYVLTKWKILTQGRYFWLRSIGSTLIGELVEIIIIATIAYIGVFTLSNVLKMAVMIYFIRIVYAVLLAWPATLIAYLLKNTEGVETYEFSTNFNPFKIE